MAVRLLRAALPRPLDSVERAIHIVEYHLQRNRIAQKSHAKRWRQAHPAITPEPLVKTLLI